MKNKIIISGILAGTLAFGLAGCASEKCEKHEHCSKPDKAAKLAAQAKVTKAEAEKAALAKVSGGTVKESELENEGGKLIWSVDISVPDSKEIKEVAVNAITGEAGAVETESEADQAKEKAEDEAKEKNDKHQSGNHEDKD